ncbi:MAG: phosphotransferase enzyme family protein [Acidiferrobacterales bacterium]
MDAVALRSGHIHDTYLATYTEGGHTIRYIHQCINQHVFPNPEHVMDNIARVLRHMHTRLERESTPDIDRRVLTLIPGCDGKPYYLDQAGRCWRTYLYIEGTRIHNVVGPPALAYRAAAAFGQFGQLLTDLTGPRLHDTVPNFHHTPKRYQNLDQAIKADVCGRAARAHQEIDFARERESIVNTISGFHARGELPERVTHNDTKINNVLFDAVSDEALCIIDLDTVMPGLVLYDFGDLVRTSTSPASEDARDLSRVYMRLPIFEALVKGYLQAIVLNERELDLLPFAGKLITFETGIRFLTDYLEGDIYFKTAHADHNLDRCRNQFQLVRSMEAQEDAMAAVVERAPRG